MVRVWDPLVRIGHWSLVVAVAAAWITHEIDAWHIGFGYATLVVVGVRLLWGVAGSGHARFAAFVRSPSETIRYARALLAHREPRHVGHNPLGAWMIVALLVTITVTGVSGWMYTTDTWWGVAWVGNLHDVAANTLLVLVALHVAGVVFSSVRHRENLVAAMVHGRKRAAERGDVG